MTRVEATLEGCPSRLGAIIGCALTAFACSAHGVTVSYFDESTYSFSREERRTIQSVADLAARDARGHLPALPRQLFLRVQPGTDVIPETGETATYTLPDHLYVTLEPGRPGGIAAIVSAHLRAALLHEMHHLVRDRGDARRTLIDAAVTEGLATAFERDATGQRVPWGEYPEDTAAWLTELQSLPADVPREPWFGRHPDGRRWVAYKVGTYLADRAAKASGRSAEDLVLVPAADVLKLAGIR